MKGPPGGKPLRQEEEVTQLTAGELEDHLRGPFENLIAVVGQPIGWDVVYTGETPLPDSPGRPDSAIHLNQFAA